MTVIISYAKTQWGLSSEPLVYKHENGYFVILMKSKEKRNSVIFSGPHLFFGKPLIVKKWTPTFDFHKEIVKVIG